MRKYFVTGLLILLPLTVTLWVAFFFLNFLTKPFIGFITFLTDEIPFASPHLIHPISQILILITLFFFTVFLGLVARKLFFHQMINWSDRFFNRIPLINKVYKTSKEIVESIFGSDSRSFKQVVLLPFPYKGAYCLGLIAKNAPQTCSRAQQDELISVFIPTTPNPSTGYLVMCKHSELIYLEMKTEEAIKYVVSCAVIQPGKKAP